MFAKEGRKEKKLWVGKAVFILPPSYNSAKRPETWPCPTNRTRGPNSTSFDLLSISGLNDMKRSEVRGHSLLLSLHSKEEALS